MRTFIVASTVFERRMYFMNAGMATAAKMPMIATTIMSSMSVKPFCPAERNFFNMDPPFLLPRAAARANRSFERAS